MSNLNDIKIINERYASRMVILHKQLINLLDGEYYELAAIQRDEIAEQTEACAVFNNVMSGCGIIKARLMLQNNNAMIMSTLIETKNK